MKKDPSPSLSFSAQVKKGPPTSCLAVSVSASDEGNWTPFLRRSRYTSFTSLTSTPPGKPCDHVWIQETESFREKGAAKQNNSESDDQKIRAWQLWSSLRKRKLLFNAIHKMHTFYRFFFFFWRGGGVEAVTCFWLCHAAHGILTPQPGTEPTPSAVKELEARYLNHWIIRKSKTSIFRD